ncbi:hypothetical protein [Streptomyces sp. NPDC006668]
MGVAESECEGRGATVLMGCEGGSTDMVEGAVLDADGGGDVEGARVPFAP